MIPTAPKVRPDFMAYGPRVVISKGIELTEDEIVETNHLDQAMADAEKYDPPRSKFYESPKVLGRLYRNIDEYLFLQELQAQAERCCSEPNHEVLGEVWNFVREQCALVEYEHLTDVAKDIKER